jgi:hypothetical protein
MGQENKTEPGPFIGYCVAGFGRYNADTPAQNNVSSSAKDLTIDTALYGLSLGISCCGSFGRSPFS